MCFHREASIEARHRSSEGLVLSRLPGRAPPTSRTAAVWIPLLQEREEFKASATGPAASRGPDGLSRPVRGDPPLTSHCSTQAPKLLQEPEEFKDAMLAQRFQPAAKPPVSPAPQDPSHLSLHTSL